MGAHYIFGWLLYLQNVYPFEVALIDVFYVVETWIFVHGTLPMEVRFLAPCWSFAVLCCYIWESYECSWFLGKIFGNIFGLTFVVSTSAWLGGELPSDSLLGDVSQGALCGLWASYFMWVNGVPTGYLLFYSTLSEFAWQLFILLLDSHSAVITIVMLIRDPLKKIYYSTFGEWWNSELNLIPIGWPIYVVIRIVFLLYKRKTHSQFAHDRGDFKVAESIIQYYNCTLAYFLLEATMCSVSFFTAYIATYRMYYIGQLFLLVIFYYYHKESRQHRGWKTFPIYLNLFADSDVAAKVIEKSTQSQFNRQ